MGSEEDERPVGESTDIAHRPQHPYVVQRLSERAAVAPRTFTLAGLLGDCDRKGYRCLYQSRSLRHSVQFKPEDVVNEREIPLEEPPFLGLAATEIELRPGAEVFFTRAQTAPAPEDFDLEFRPRQVADAIVPPAAMTDWMHNMTYWMCPEQHTRQMHTCYWCPTDA
jgi:hypothetical protein